MPKRFAVDKAVLHSAQGIAATGFAVEVVELARQPRTLENVTLREINDAVPTVRDAARRLRRALDGKKVGGVGAWLGGTVLLLACDAEFDACAVVCPFLRLQVGQPKGFRQPLEMVRSARAPILAVFGELDGEVPIEDVRTLEKVLSASPETDESYTYPGVGHAFFDKEEGNTEYLEPAERDLWMRMDRFFAHRMG